jgi:uncharacterized lipoprotein YddW (UPF0748 family)
MIYMPKQLLIIISVCSLLLFYSCASSKKTVKLQTGSTPKAFAEFRAAWVATVANINWPGKPGLSTEQQQREAIELLDFLQANHFNAVIFQVRPQADALYQSSLEPWSYYLTGVQGKAPEPYYDPLQFWTEAAHDRGLELHVWLNPYRAHHVVGGPVSDSSLVKKHPELVVKLKEGYWWFDPSKKGVQDHAREVVMDIVKRYDIDGVHFDDYFYPYPSYNLNEDFPDSTSWTAYQQSGGKLPRGDWRRESVNQLIERLYKDIKATKKHVKFGLSPFGIWRPGYPRFVDGFDQYDQLYADARLWLNKGWIDYFAPQLYWPINRYPQSFPVLLGWWSAENTMGRHVWPGISVGSDTSARNTNEILSQIMISRGMLPKSSGVVHWSISSLTKNLNMTKAILEGPYKMEALVPASTWLDDKAPEAPVVQTAPAGDSLKISWTHPDEKDVFRWVVHYQYGSTWRYKILNRGERTINIKLLQGKNKLTHVGVSAVDRTGNESAFKEIENTVTPPVVSIVPRLGWNANEPKPYKQHTPVRITIHHEGSKFDITGDAPKHIKNVQVWGMGKDRNWTDIPYHFIIAPNGAIYEGRDPFTVGETATEYDPAGHLLIMCMGNFEEQEVPPAQLDALTRMVAYACKKYNIPQETIASHKDHSSKTDCPGKNLYHYLQNGYIQSKVKEFLHN